LSTDFDAELRRMAEVSKDVRNPKSEEAAGASKGLPKIQVMPDAMLHPLLDYLSVMSLELRASLATVEKQSDEANKLFAQAQQQEKGLGYREPPVYIRPVAETEAAALVAIGDWSGGKEAYRRALQRRPRSGFALYGIAMCNEKLGDMAAASQGYAEFLTAWKYADAGLPELTHAQNFIAEHPLHAAVSGASEQRKV
jgi:tetratricopeptide (TPR) repeat protein